MKNRKIPKPLIKKTGKLSPEMEYNQLNALEMQLGALEYFLNKEPETLEESLKMIEIGTKLINDSGYQINPDSKLGILFKRVNTLKSDKIQKKLDELETKARKDIESDLLEEELNLNIEEINNELEKKGGNNDSK